jgi:transposase
MSVGPGELWIYTRENMKNKTNTQEGACDKRVEKVNITKLGVDVHADSIRAVRQKDGSMPQPAQKLTWEGFMAWAAKQMKQAQKVYSCYEAGPLGYGLHRKLTELGIVNIVVRPQNWDELGKGVKSDKTHALALVQHLDRYLGGNSKALSVVYVPTLEQEVARSQSRLREQMRKNRQRMEAQGRTLLLYYGIRVKGRWWGARG